MTEVSTHPSMAVIVGPTASGKSTLAVALAEKCNGEVVACDSTQLYRGFDIGTAKPDAAERRGISHHLLDILDATEDSTAGGYRERALAVLADLRARGKVPIFTVGTGLYLRALLEGLAAVPQRSEEIRKRLRQTINRHSAGHLHRILTKLDPFAAGKIAMQDEQKLIRAIEICLLAKKPLSEIHRAGRNPLAGWRVLKIGLQPSRELLYQRIHARTQSMLARGWLDEVRGLLASGLSGEAKPFQFIGYRDLLAVLEHRQKLEQAQTLIQQATRQYAKRQLTWFRRDQEIHWLPGFGDSPQIQAQALQVLSANGLP